MRTSVRAPSEGLVRFTARSDPKSETTSGEGRLQNTSTGGMCLITDKCLTPGDTIELTVLSCDEKNIFRGDVAHTEESKLGYVVGVRFDIDHPETEESIMKLATLGAKRN
jgi:hypothetical protein